jgi:uncharacterized protein YkwD
MGLAQPLIAITIGMALPSGASLPASDSSALAAAAAACTSVGTATGDPHSRLEAMYCGINVVRRTYGLGRVRGSVPLNRSSLWKADAVKRCGFSHTPCGMSFAVTFRRAGYLPARAFGENLAWGQGDLATARNITIAWMNSPGHRHNILEAGFTEVGIGIVPGTPGDPSWGATYTTDFGNVREAAAPQNAVASAAVAGTTAASRKATTKKAAKRCKTTTVRARAASAKGRKRAKAKRVTTCGTITARAAKTKRA